MPKADLFAGTPAIATLGEVVTDSFTFNASGQLVGIDPGGFAFSLDNTGGALTLTADSVTVSTPLLTLAGATDSLGFFGHTPATRPEIAASPTAQGIVTALVALGLVTQAA